MHQLNTERGESFLAFMIHSEVYAIEATRVLEVLEIQELTRLPKSSKILKGILNLRGDVLPVIDLRLKLSSKEINESHKNVIIVVEISINDKIIKIGAIADSVKEVLNIKPDQILPAPSVISTNIKDLINGVYRQESMFYLLLNIDQALADIVLNSTQHL